jgi:colanic acid biosynthesis glycosyl transferase WcaI
MSARILLISQVFYPDEVSTANLFTNLCSVLIEDNVDVEVWCAQPSYTKLEKQPKNIVYKGINIYFLASTNFRKSKLFGRLINYFTFTISAVSKLLFSKEKITVFTHTTPPSLGIILSFICCLKRRKFVYILLDIFPEGLIRLGKFSKKNILIKIWHKLFIASLINSDRIVTIGRDMKQWVGKVYPKGLDKVEYIPLWQDDNLIFPSDYISNEYVIKRNIQNVFVVQYSGNMGLWNEMSTIGKVVKKNLHGVVFMFVGGGMRKNELFDIFSNEDMMNIISLPFQPNEKLSNILTACHVGLVSLKQGLEGMAVPSKIYGIMAAGIPIIALVPPNSEIAYILEEENCGIVINSDDIEGLTRTIADMKSNIELRKEMGRNGRNAFERKYTTKKIATKYKLLIEALK